MITAAITCVFLLEVVSAEASPKTAKLKTSAITDGTTWFCETVSMSSGGNHAEFSDCTRSLRQCKKRIVEVRERLEQQDPDHILGKPVASECVEQKNAAVYTFRNLMKDQYIFQAFPDMSACKDSRSIAARSEDFREFSNCERVGAVVASRPKIKMLRPGKGWHCFEASNGRSRCSRTETECEEDRVSIAAKAPRNIDIDESCTASNSAFVFTTNDHYSASLTQAECELIRNDERFRSGCERIE